MEMINDLRAICTKKNHKKYFEPPETYFDRKWVCVCEFYDSWKRRHFSAWLVSWKIMFYMVYVMEIYCSTQYSNLHKNLNRVFILLHKKVLHLHNPHVTLLKNIKSVLQFSQLNSNSHLIIFFLPVYPSTYKHAPLKNFLFFD